MSPNELLSLTTDHLDNHPHDSISLLNRMSLILKPAVPYGKFLKYLQATAQVLGEHHPPGSAVICADYRGLDMLTEADGFISRRYGNRNATIILSRWCRRAAEGWAYLPAALHIPKPLSMPFIR